MSNLTKAIIEMANELRVHGLGVNLHFSVHSIEAAGAVETLVGSAIAQATDAPVAAAPAAQTAVAAAEPVSTAATPEGNVLTEADLVGKFVLLKNTGANNSSGGWVAADEGVYLTAEEANDNSDYDEAVFKIVESSANGDVYLNVYRSDDSMNDGQLPFAKLGHGAHGSWNKAQQYATMKTLIASVGAQRQDS